MICRSPSSLNTHQPYSFGPDFVAVANRIYSFGNIAKRDFQNRYSVRVCQPGHTKRNTRLWCLAWQISPRITEQNCTHPILASAYRVALRLKIFNVPVIFPNNASASMASFYSGQSLARKMTMIPSIDTPSSACSDDKRAFSASYPAAQTLCLIYAR